MMNIVDNYSSRVWSIPLKGKGDTFENLTTWECTRELETELKVGTYITDNGELKSNKMRDWIASRGTNQLFTAPYTSAHNGHVEHMHQTLMAKAWTMRIYSKCPVLICPPQSPAGLTGIPRNPEESPGILRNPQDSCRTTL
jgi:hypothetical protein